MKLSLILSGILVGFITFAGCGSSDGDVKKTTKYVGYLLDSPIVGVAYECIGGSGKTDNSGKFTCESAPVTFKVGGWVVGKLNKLTTDHKVYPQDLVGVSRDNFTDAKLINLVRMLQSLDDDGDISTSINITNEAHKKLKDATKGLTLVQLAKNLGREAVSAEDAISHLKDNMQKKEGNDNTGNQNNQGKGNGSNQTGNSSSTWTPVSNNFTCDPKPTTIAGYTTDYRYAAEGAIKVECQTTENAGQTYTLPKYSLNGVEELEIVEMTKVVRTNGSVEKYGNFTTKEEYNFKTGTRHIVEQGYGTNIDCQETYPSILPKTVSMGDSVSSIIELDFNDNDRINTTCPSSYYDKSSDDEVQISRGNYTETVDIIIKDSNGKTTKISTEQKSKY